MKFRINKVAVLGAGVMGAEIAAHLAGAGLSVILMDMIPRELKDSHKKKGIVKESSAFRNSVAIEGLERVSNPKNLRIYHKDFAKQIEVGNFTDDLSRINECDWVVEVIVENLEIKKSFMKNVFNNCRPKTIISSNTSGVSVNRIVEDLPLEFREYFLGTHFFNPTRYMKLIELIPNKDSNPELVKFMEWFGTHKLGKGIVICKDTPNFIANRIGMSMFTPARLIEKYKLDIATVDALTGSAIGRPNTGTFKLMDMVGLDIIDKASSNVIDVATQNEIDSLKFPNYLYTLIERGYLGDKTKGGFYKKIKTDTGRENLVWDLYNNVYVPFKRKSLDIVKEAKESENKYSALAYGDKLENKFIWEVLKTNILYAADKAMEIADDYKSIDNAIMWGYNWEIGPFGIWDKLGVEKSIERMKNEGHSIPNWVEDRIKNGETTFYNSDDQKFDYINPKSKEHKIIIENKDAKLVDIGDDVACFLFKTKGNSVTDGVTELLSKSIDLIEKNYKGMIIGNQDKNFCVGANLSLVAELAAEEKWEELSEIVENFQMTLKKMKYCKVPVVAAPHGMTLGGGAEIVLHSSSVVAHAETYMGLVEMGVGLVPAGGGAKEMALRSVENLVNKADALPFVTKAWELISSAKVSSSGFDAMKQGFIRKSDLVVMNKDYQIMTAKRKVIELSDNGFRPLVEKSYNAIGIGGRASIQFGLDAMKNGNFISDHDMEIGKKIAGILTGGQVLKGSIITENDLLYLEREAFISLAKTQKTQDRIIHMLKKGKPLRN